MIACTRKLSAFCTVSKTQHHTTCIGCSAMCIPTPSHVHIHTHHAHNPANNTSSHVDTHVQCTIPLTDTVHYPTCTVHIHITCAHTHHTHTYTHTHTHTHLCLHGWQQPPPLLTAGTHECHPLLLSSPRKPTPEYCTMNVHVRCLNVVYKEMYCTRMMGVAITHVHAGYQVT